MDRKRSDTPEIVVAGHICLDVIPTFGTGAARLEDLLVPGKLVEVGPPVVATGGAVSNTGLALHRLGLPTRLIGKVGSDLFGRAILSLLRGYGEALADGMLLAEGEPTSYTLVINPPGVDRVFLHCPGVNDTFRPDEVALDPAGAARLFHFGYPPLMRQTYADGGEGLAALFQQLRAQGLVVSLDMARPDPHTEAGRVDWAAWLRRVLPHVDVFGPSLDELLFMLDPAPYNRLPRGTGPEGGLEAALLGDLADRLLKMGAAIVVLKLGADGLYLRTTSIPERLSALARLRAGRLQPWLGRELLHPCFSVQVAGTTGSGDSTLAGLLAALLHGQAPEDALKTAVAVGACSVEQADATSGVPAWPDVQRRIQTGWALRSTTLSLPGWHARNGLFLGPQDANRWN